MGSTYYWDSCLFLAWLKDEQNRKSGEMDGVRDVVERVNKRQIQLVTSAITHTEVTESKLPSGTMTMFEGLLRRKAVSVVAADIKISKLARELRDYYSSRPDDYNGKTLSVPDAIHLATAIIYKPTEFHTFDRKNRGGSLGLLNLGSDIAGYRLTICRPTAIQTSIDLRGGG